MIMMVMMMTMMTKVMMMTMVMMVMILIPTMAVGEKVERVGGAAAATPAISRQEKQRRA